MKKNQEKWLRYLGIAAVILIMFNWISYLDTVEEKSSYVCNEIEDIATDYKVIPYVPTGNKLVDSLEAEKPAGYTADVQERIQLLKNICKNGVSK